MKNFKQQMIPITNFALKSAPIIASLEVNFMENTWSPGIEISDSQKKYLIPKYRVLISISIIFFTCIAHHY